MDKYVTMVCIVIKFALQMKIIDAVEARNWHFVDTVIIVLTNLQPFQNCNSSTIIWSYGLHTSDTLAICVKRERKTL